MSKIICGKNPVLDAIKNNEKIETLYLLRPLNLHNKNIKIEIISRDEMNQLTDLNHQGYVAIMKENFKYQTFDELLNDNPEIVLVIDHIEDPHNFGAIIRSVNAFGIKHVIIPKERAAHVTETVIRVSSGGILGINVVLVNSLQVAIEKLKQKNFWVYASAIDKGKKLSDVKYNFPLVIIVGNEGKGVSKSLLKQSDQNIFIPMYGSVQSLNVSVATGIILYEVTKEKK